MFKKYAIGWWAMGATALCHYSYWTSGPNWVDLSMMFVNLLSLFIVWLITTPAPYVMFVIRTGMPDRKHHYQYMWMAKVHAWILLRSHYHFHIYKDADHA
jgi:hypothetical protein